MIVHPKARGFRASKEGEALADCQDFVLPPPDKTVESTVFAVADGTTTSFFASRWAELLVENWKQPGEVLKGFYLTPDERQRCWEDWLTPVQDRWHEAVKARLHEGSDIDPDTRLVFENRMTDESDAGATFLGLKFDLHADGTADWQALAVGDSCLFHLREDGAVVAPLTEVSQFAFQTTVISSVRRDTEVHWISSGDPGNREAQPGDVFLLATDELSKWLLKSQAESRPVWGELVRLLGRKYPDIDFLALVDRARKDKEKSVHSTPTLGNDDIGLVVIVFGEAHPIYSEASLETDRGAQPVVAEAAVPYAAGLTPRILESPRKGVPIAMEETVAPVGVASPVDQQAETVVTPGTQSTPPVVRTAFQQAISDEMSKVNALPSPASPADRPSSKSRKSWFNLPAVTIGGCVLLLGLLAYQNFNLERQLAAARTSARGSRLGAAQQSAVGLREESEQPKVGQTGAAKSPSTYEELTGKVKQLTDYTARLQENIKNFTSENEKLKRENVEMEKSNTDLRALIKQKDKEIAAASPSPNATPAPDPAMLPAITPMPVSTPDPSSTPKKPRKTQTPPPRPQGIPATGGHTSTKSPVEQTRHSSILDSP